MNLDFLNTEVPAEVKPVVEAEPVAEAAPVAAEEAAGLTPEQQAEFDNQPVTMTTGCLTQILDRLKRAEQEIISINNRLTFCANTGQMHLLSKDLAPTELLDQLQVVHPLNVAKKPTLADVRPPTNGRRPKNKPLPGYNGIGEGE